MLTWGRESIKDHTTAVLELVKNSYDANARIVEVEIRVGLLAEAGPYIRIADDGVGGVPRISWRLTGRSRHGSLRAAPD